MSCLPPLYYLFKRKILLLTYATIRSSICGFCLICGKWAIQVSVLMHLQFSGWTFFTIKLRYFLFYIFLRHRYIFSTEGHLLPATPQISLLREHCLYYGAYCRSGDLRQTYFVPESNKDKKESNDAGLKLHILRTTLLLSQVPFQVWSRCLVLFTSISWLWLGFHITCAKYYT